MPELQEPPPLTGAENLAADFDRALKAITPETDDVGREVEVEKVAPKKEVERVEEHQVPDSLIPEEFLGKPKPEEKKSEQEEEIPANANAKMLRDALARKEGRIAAMQKELEQFKKAPVPNAGAAQEHVDALRAAEERATKLEQEFERVAYERSPKFKKFDADRSDEISAAKGYVEGSDISPSIIEAAAASHGSARVKLLRDNGVDTETISAIMPHLAAADRLQRERDSSLENWRASMEQETKQQTAKQRHEEQQRIADEQRVFKEVGDQMKKDNPAFTRVEGNARWNAIVEQNERDAEEFIAGSKPLPELMKLAYLGVSARTALLMKDEMTKKYHAAMDENARLKAAQPGTGKSVTASAVKSNPDDPKQSASHYAESFDRHLAAAKGS